MLDPLFGEEYALRLALIRADAQAHGLDEVLSKSRVSPNPLSARKLPAAWIA